MSIAGEPSHIGPAEWTTTGRRLRAERGQLRAHPPQVGLAGPARRSAGLTGYRVWKDDIDYFAVLPHGGVRG
ncbi:MAG: hypothetical protein HYS14_06160 [Candidatus Rokubacteria bacterium]|nr:hypothetical protein [Candidatus Rokubacteria bacterium]